MNTFAYLFSMFEEKNDHPLHRLSMTRTLAALFAGAYVMNWQAPLGWPDAFVIFVILFSVGVSKALRAASPKAVLDMLSKMFGKGTPAQIVGGVPFVPNQWAHGDPEEGVL